MKSTAREAGREPRLGKMPADNTQMEAPSMSQIRHKTTGSYPLVSDSDFVPPSLKFWDVLGAFWELICTPTSVIISVTFIEIRFVQLSICASADEIDKGRQRIRRGAQAHPQKKHPDMSSTHKHRNHQSPVMHNGK